MTDIVDRVARSRMMAGIRGKNTKPELQIRRTLFRQGIRYRLHDTRLPGQPDLVLPKYHAVIFVHGCFWHGHQCHLFRWPKTRKQFWRNKILRNHAVDKKVAAQLRSGGWRVLTIWECALKGPGRRSHTGLAEKATVWLKSKRMTMQIRGETKVRSRGMRVKTKNRI